jgi:hypothetical protein
MLGYDPRVFTEPFDFWSLQRQLTDVKPPRWFGVLQAGQPVGFALAAAVGLSKGGFGHLAWFGYLAVVIGATNFVLASVNLGLSWKEGGRLARPTGVQWAWAGVTWGVSLSLLVSFVL